MVDLVIPVYKPKEEFVNLLSLINKQTVKVHKIILMNTEKEYWDEFLGKYKEVASYENIEVYHLSKEEFDHLTVSHLSFSSSFLSPADTLGQSYLCTETPKPLVTKPMILSPGSGLQHFAKRT